MDIQDKIIIVTGAASGIGLALSKGFLEKGAAHVFMTDVNESLLNDVAANMDSERVSAIHCDVASATSVESLVATVIKNAGRIDIFCCNAGIARVNDIINAPDSEWELSFGVNVMGHVYAARYALPHMIKQGHGYFLNTVSAAGLLSQIGSATYAVSKHAAIGFAESLAIEYADKGIKVSVLCPQAVRTPMITEAGAEDGGVAGLDGVLEPEDVCESALKGIEEESFLILPHAGVAKYMQHKVNDYDRWLRGMSKLKANMEI